MALSQSNSPCVKFVHWLFLKVSQNKPPIASTHLDSLVTLRFINVRACHTHQGHGEVEADVKDVDHGEETQDGEVQAARAQQLGNFHLLQTQKAVVSTL